METVTNSVLIVDDEAINIRALFEILSEDYTLYVEKSGTNCIRAAKQLTPDIILLDVMMPEMDGFDVIKALKADETTKDIPIIFVTGLVGPDDESRGFSLGAVDYIKKPYSEQVVKMRVRHQMQIINQQRKIQALREAEEIERKRQEQEKINKRIQLILDSAPISVEIYNENKELIDANMGTLNLHGIDNKDEFLKLYNENPGDFSPKYQPDGSCSLERIERLFEESSKRKYMQFDWIHKSYSGEEFPAEVTLTCIEADDTTLYVAYVHDLRKIKKLENERFEALEDASRAKSRFLARMSHEIRTPITAVLGISEVLLREKKVPPYLDEAFTKIYDSSKTLFGIVNDILDFSRIESGNMPLFNKEYDVPSLIYDSAGLYLVFLEHKDITFEVRVDEKLPISLIGDVLRVKQIINNLLSNAFKYTKSGSVVMSFECEDVQNDHMTLVVRIEDTGVGMTPEQIEAIKGEYVRFNEEETSYVSGTGLGIPIVYSLAQMMNARFDCNSEVGKGTTVTIRIPQMISGTELLGPKLVQRLENFEFNTSTAREELEFVPTQMPYGKVLVVDDVDTNLYVAEAMLESFGLTVELCDSGLHAIDKVKNGEVFDIIFMDQMMPEMDGIEVTKKLRELGYNHPIVALTANAIKSYSDTFEDSGFSGFMTKPIDIRELSSYLDKFVVNKER